MHVISSYSTCQLFMRERRGKVVTKFTRIITEREWDREREKERDAWCDHQLSLYNDFKKQGEKIKLIEVIN